MRGACAAHPFFKVNMVKDYKNFDYFSVSLKRDKERQMVRSYLAFGWEVVERGEDKRFSDYITYTFRRPHKIANKDRLQYLQVKMEKSINLLAKLKRRRHSVSAISGITLLVVAALLIAGGITLLCVTKTAKLTGLGIVLIAAGVAVVPLAVFWIVKRAKKENERYLKTMQTSEIEVESAVVEAATLNGVIK